MYSYIVVDDEELTRKGTIKKLASMEGEIVCVGEAENGQKALELIERVHPDVAILDMQMPVMDGTALLPELSKRYPELSLIVISGYRDFDYVKHAMGAHAIDYVLKPFSPKEIIRCMRAAISRIEDKSEMESRILVSEEEKEMALYEYDIQNLQGLLRGYETKKGKVSSKRLLFVNQASFVAVFVLLLWKGVKEDMVKSWIACQDLSGMAVFLPSQGEERLLAVPLFMGQGGGNTDALHALGEDLLDFMRQQGCPIALGISGLHPSLEDLSVAYKEAKEALDGQSLIRKSALFTFSQEREPLQVSWDKWDELLFRIEAGSVTEVKELMEEFYAYLTEVPGFTLFDAKYQGYLLAGECRRILSYYVGQMAAKKKKKKKKSIVSVTSTIYDGEELWAYLVVLATNLAGLLKSQSVFAQEDVIESIKAYMERNYQKDLSQERVSYLFYISRSYLSSLFKAKTGVKFVDYLNTIRVEKAKELLATTERKMYFVAKAVGYDNVKYFFRVFKKHTGTTPEKYRLMMQENKENKLE